MHSKDAHNLFIYLIKTTEALQEKYIDQTEATNLAIDR
jgi:hypothetical protein